jgi:pyruvate formate lyase activating enzyme
MKVCIFDIKRFAVHDGPGIRTTAFFKGCPLECWWCHNPEGIKKEPEQYTEEVELDGVRFEREVQVGRWIDTGELMDEMLRDRVFMEESGGGLSFSGGEPLLQPEALFHLLELSRNSGIHSCVDTSGYCSAATMEKLTRSTDMILYDLKSLDDDIHLKYTGVNNQGILENLSLAINGNAEVIVRIPLVAGFNTSEMDIERMLGKLKELEGLEKVDLLPYHRFGTHKYSKFKMENKQNGFGSPTKKRINEIRELFCSEGFTVSIGG